MSINKLNIKGKIEREYFVINQEYADYLRRLFIDKKAKTPHSNKYIIRCYGTADLKKQFLEKYSYYIFRRKKEIYNHRAQNKEHALHVKGELA